MDSFTLVIGTIILLSGLVMAYLFSPKKSKDTPVPAEVRGNLQKFSESGFMEVPLAKILKITHDTYMFTYNLPDPDLPLGLQVGQHIVVHAELPTKEFPQGEQIRRKYTPISKVDQKGTFDLVIKVYRRNTHPKFPEGGILSQHLETMKVGDKLKISGPIGKLSYHGHGKFMIQRTEVMQHLKVKEVGLVCGGTGITPMYQVMRAILDTASDKTNVHLLFGNKTEDDILLRPELEGIATDPRIKIHFTLDIGNAGWKGFTGFVTKEMLQKTMPYPGKDTLICTCGPPVMTKMLQEQIIQLGYTEDQIFKF